MKTVFLRVLDAVDKKEALLKGVRGERAGNAILYTVNPILFSKIPKSPFAYWISDEVRELFVTLPPLESEGRAARQGGVSGNDFRWLRLWTEPLAPQGEYRWIPIAKGGYFSRFYADLPLVVRWDQERHTFAGFTGLPHRPSLQPASSGFYFRPGLTWPLRTQSGLGLRIMPTGCVFGHKGPAVFVELDAPRELLAMLAVTSSSAFRSLVDLQMAFGIPSKLASFNGRRCHKCPVRTR